MKVIHEIHVYEAFRKLLKIHVRLTEKMNFKDFLHQNLCSNFIFHEALKITLYALISMLSCSLSCHPKI